MKPSPPHLNKPTRILFVLTHLFASPHFQSLTTKPALIYSPPMNHQYFAHCRHLRCYGTRSTSPQTHSNTALCVHRWTHTKRTCPQCRAVLKNKLAQHSLSTFRTLTASNRQSLLNGLNISNSSLITKLLKQVRKQLNDTRSCRKLTRADRTAALEYLLHHTASHHNTLALAQRWRLSKRQVWYLLDCAKRSLSNSAASANVVTDDKKEFIKKQLDRGTYPNAVVYSEWSQLLGLSIGQLRNLVWKLKQPQNAPITAHARISIQQWFNTNNPPRRPTSEEYSQLAHQTGLNRSQIQKIIANLMPPSPNTWPRHQQATPASTRQHRISPSHKELIYSHLIENHITSLGDPIDYSLLQELTQLTLPQLHNQVSYMRKQLKKGEVGQVRLTQSE
mmetsp:Transcript_5561/g.20923  ORF Transcript_5561/g.20923 Transcript_5561/m.20923 type:complete len:391 (+) Transcript_5561:1327-2499(+)